MVWGGGSASLARARHGEGAEVVAWPGADTSALVRADVPVRPLEAVIGEEGLAAAEAAARTWARLWGRVPLLDGRSFRDLVAWRETGRSLFAVEARGILDFSLHALRHPRGGFYSALSADSPVAGNAAAHMLEGAYYTWDWEQLTAALGEEGVWLDWAVARYGLSRRGNALHDPLGEMAGRNVLIELLDEGQLAKRFDVDLLTVKQRNARVNDLLRTARETRPPGGA